MLSHVHLPKKYELILRFLEFMCEYFQRKKHVFAQELILVARELVILIEFLQFLFVIYLFLTNLSFQTKIEIFQLHLSLMKIDVFYGISFQLTLFLQNNWTHLQKYKVDLLQKFQNKYFHFKLPNKHLLMRNNLEFCFLFKHGKSLNQQEFLCLFFIFLNQPNK